MDNLTHSLAGAVLGQMGLKRKTAMAMPTLIIAANIPDIDAVCSVFGVLSLAMRRGLTHGPIALVLLPVLLTGLMLLYDRHKRKTAPDRPPVHAAWLLALAYIGTLSHPALDWLNNYGIRLLEPFSSQWFYGDTLFIVDLWIWAALGFGVWMSRRREKHAVTQWRRPAQAAFFAVCLYIAANGLITRRAEQQTAEAVVATRGTAANLVVANAVPVAFWQRQMQWRNATEYGAGDYALGRGVKLSPVVRPHLAGDPRVSVSGTSDEPARAFLFWSRMPVARMEKGRVILNDQRFMNALVRDRFQVEIRTAPIDQGGAQHSQ